MDSIKCSYVLLFAELLMTTTDNPGLANFTVFRPPKVDRALQKVRITCLTLQALLTWCTLLGLFLTAVCGTITLNRVLLQEQIANQGFELSQATLKRQASARASERSLRRKSVVSAVRKVSRALSTVTSRKVSTITQSNIRRRRRHGVHWTLVVRSGRLSDPV